MTREQFITHVENCQVAFRRFLVALCCGDTSLADDIAQESYIKAYLACDSFRDDSKFATWIYRIGYTTFLNHRRSAHPTVDYEQAAGISAPDFADASFSYQALYAALDRLGAHERTSVLLYYIITVR